METLLGVVASGAGMLVLFVLYLGGAAAVLKVLDGILPRGTARR